MARKTSILVIALLVVLSFGLFVGTKLKVPHPAIASAAGKTAPDFALKDQDGKDFALNSERGHKVLVMFYRGYW